jgi:hypothetical protein
VPIRRSSAPRTDPVVNLDRVASAVRDVVRAIAPELRIEKRWGAPWYVGTDLVFHIGTYSRHVGVEFWRGTTVRDPGHLLEGTGKNLRHVKLRSTQDATTPRFVALLREAVRLDQAEPPRVRSSSR